jgi:hypothetical protein
LAEELKARDSEAESNLKLKKLLDYLNSQLAREKQSCEELRSEVQQLDAELEENCRLVEDLKAENKQLYENTRLDSRRVKHLSHQLESLSTKSLEEVFHVEGESLQIFSVDQNEQMQLKVSKYQDKVRLLKDKLALQTRSLETARQKASIEEANKLISLASDNEFLIAENETLKSLIENSKSKRQANLSRGPSRGPSRTPSLNLSSLKVMSMEIYSLGSKLKADETSLLRSRVKDQDANIARLLCIKASLLVSLDQLSRTNKELEEETDRLRASQQETTRRLEETVKAKLELRAQYDNEMRFMSAILSEVESEVVGIRVRYSSDSQCYK